MELQHVDVQDHVEDLHEGEEDQEEDAEETRQVFVNHLKIKCFFFSFSIKTRLPSGSR